MVKRGKSFDLENWEESPDLTSLPEGEIKELLAALSEEEEEISYRRRVLQGRIDLLRSELVCREGTSVSPDDLAQALMGDAPRETEKTGGDPQYSDEHLDENSGENLGDSPHSGRGLG